MSFVSCIPCPSSLILLYCPLFYRERAKRVTHERNVYRAKYTSVKELCTCGAVEKMKSSKCMILIPRSWGTILMSSLSGDTESGATVPSSSSQSLPSSASLRPPLQSSLHVTPNPLSAAKSAHDITGYDKRQAATEGTENSNPVFAWDQTFRKTPAPKKTCETQ